MVNKMKFLGYILLAVIIATPLIAQRSKINSGVDNYENGKYADAEVNFKKGLEENMESFEGHFNLGDAYYQQGRYDEAIKSYQNALGLAKDDYMKSKVFHNIGNSLLKAQKLKESVGAYAEALKHDPNDIETKYNLSYALKQMQQQQQQQNQDQNQDNKDKKEQNKDQQQKQQQDQNKDNKEKKNKDDQQQQQQQDQNKQDQKQQQQQPQQQKEQMSKQQAQRILEALKKNESDLQKKLRKKKAKVVPKSKDW